MGSRAICGVGILAATLVLSSSACKSLVMPTEDPIDPGVAQLTVLVVDSLGVPVPSVDVEWNSEPHDGATQERFRESNRTNSNGLASFELPRERRFTLYSRVHCCGDDRRTRFDLMVDTSEIGDSLTVRIDEYNIEGRVVIEGGASVPLVEDSDIRLRWDALGSGSRPQFTVSMTVPLSTDGKFRALVPATTLRYDVGLDIENTGGPVLDLYGTSGGELRVDAAVDDRPLIVVPFRILELNSSLAHPQAPTAWTRYRLQNAVGSSRVEVSFWVLTSPSWSDSVLVPALATSVRVEPAVESGILPFSGLYDLGRLASLSLVLAPLLLEVTLTDATGRPINGSVVSNPRTLFQVSVPTGGDGRAQLFVNPSRYDLTLEAAGYVSKDVSLTVLSDDSLAVVLERDS